MAIAGNDIAISNTASSANNISVSSVLTALTGTGSTNPAVSAPQTMTPVTTSNATEAGTDSLWGGLGGGTAKTPSSGGIITPGQAYPGAGLGVDPTSGSGIALKTNSQTMMWLLLGGGLLLVTMGGGGRRH